MIGRISGLFFDTLTASQKYSLLNRDNLTQHTQMQLSVKAKAFSQFFYLFLKCKKKFENSLNKLKLIADVFCKLRIPQSVVS